jgi:hypothetical protein
MKEIAVHINDLKDLQSTFNQYNRVNVVLFEEIDCMQDEDRLRKKIDHNNVQFWFGDTGWPSHCDKRFLYYLWASATDQTVKYKSYVSRHFISLNNTPKKHRIQFLNMMYEHYLFSYSLISWSNRKTKIKGIKQTIDWLGDRTNDKPASILPIINLPMKEINRSAVSIVLETYIDKNDISEKTFQCLAVAQPFITYGMPYLYYNLTQMGFKLLPLIDYTFDSEGNHVERQKMIIKELKKLIEYKAQDLKNIFKEVSLYNQERFKEIVRTLEFPFACDIVLSKDLEETKKHLLVKQSLYQ